MRKTLDLFVSQARRVQTDTRRGRREMLVICTMVINDASFRVTSVSRILMMILIDLYYDWEGSCVTVTMRSTCE